MKIKEKSWYLFLTGAGAIVTLGIFLAYGDHWARTWAYLGELKILYLAALIPVVWLMYLTAGGIWGPYFEDEGLSIGFLGRVQYELAFVNGVVPFLDMLSGAEYAEARLGRLDVSREKSNGMYLYRYVISIATKWLLMAVALTIIMKSPFREVVHTWAAWIVGIAIVLVAICFVVGFVCYGVRLDVSEWFGAEFQQKLDELYAALELVLAYPVKFVCSLIAGILYSFAEIMPYLVIAGALGHVEVFLPIMAASGLGIIGGGVTCTPMGIGGYEATIALIAWGLGFDPVLTVLVLVVERVLMTVGTGLTGYWFWKRGTQEIASIN